MLVLVFPLCFDTSASPNTLYTHPPLSHLFSVGRWHPVGSVTAPSGFAVVIIPASTALCVGGGVRKKETVLTLREKAFIKASRLVSRGSACDDVQVQWEAGVKGRGDERTGHLSSSIWEEVLGKKVWIWGVALGGKDGAWEE
ncbi:hypothetical protein SRHO_G00229630 [Serrasalmus rhombeus]